MKEAVAAISAILILCAGPPYIVNTIRGNTQPERMTWFVFSALGVIAFASQLLLGASWSLVFSGLDTAASIVIFVLSLWYGVGGYTKLDTTALIVAAVGVAIALLVKQPLISLSGVILADGSGTILTIRKAFIHPESETTISWLLTGTAALFGLLAVGKLTINLLLYPFYLMLANYLVPVAQFAGFKLGRQRT